MRNAPGFIRRMLPAAATALCCTLCSLSSALADSLQPVDVPAAIAVPAGNRLFLIVHAVGTQNYTCTGTGAWSAAVPKADLFSDNTHQVGTHYIGPTWQLQDGSSVVGQKINAVT